MAKKTINEEFGKLGPQPDLHKHQMEAMAAMDEYLAGRRERGERGETLRMLPRGGGKSVLAAQLEAAAVKCGYTVVRHPVQRYTMLFDPKIAEAVSTEGRAELDRLRKMAVSDREFHAQADDIRALSPRQRYYYSFLMNSSFVKHHRPLYTHETALAAAKEIHA